MGSWVLHTCRGFENWCVQEVQSLFSNWKGYNVTHIRPGLVLLVLSGDSCETVISLLSTMRSLTRVSFLLLDIQELLFDSNITEFLEDCVSNPRLYPPLVEVETGELWEKSIHALSIVNSSLKWESPSFRVTCVRERSFTGQIPSPEIAGMIGFSVGKSRGWRVDCKNFDIEVIALVHGDMLTVGVVILDNMHHRWRHPLCDYKTKLMPSIAHLLVRACDPKPGQILWDPLCGVGTVPIEAAEAWPSLYVYGSDISEEAIVEAKRNFDYARDTGLKHHVEFLTMDVRNLPSNSVDIICSDLPFGHRHGSLKSMRALYPVVVKSIGNCLKRGGIACLLTKGRKPLQGLIEKHEELHYIDMFNVYIHRYIVTVHRVRKTV